MNNFDYFSLDGHKLSVLLAVIEERSVTKAAERLGVTQSSVSHSLNKLRNTFDDPLFVRSGRNIVPTERALALLEPTREALQRLKMLNDSRPFDPNCNEMEFTIAVNDFLLELILSPIVNKLYKQGINIRYHFMPAQVPDLALLRNGKINLIVTPFPPEGDDIFQLRLFSDRLMCFYDANARKPPISKQSIFDSKRVDVVFGTSVDSMQAVFSYLNLEPLPKPHITVPNFSSLAEFILGTEMVTLQMGLMKKTSMKDLASSNLAFKTRKLDFYLVWHRLYKDDPAHIWLRKIIFNHCQNF